MSLPQIFVFNGSIELAEHRPTPARSLLAEYDSVQPAATLSSIPRFGPVDSEATLSWPLRGRLTNKFGSRGHEGIDIDGKYGDEVMAAAEGVVTQAGTQGGYGKTVIIHHRNGLVTLYAHLSRLLVRAGDRVERGEVIGNVGHSGNATGTHLHFEVRRNGQPVDPITYLQLTRVTNSPRPHPNGTHTRDRIDEIAPSFSRVT